MQEQIRGASRMPRCPRRHKTSLRMFNSEGFGKHGQAPAFSLLGNERPFPPCGPALGAKQLLCTTVAAAVSIHLDVHLGYVSRTFVIYLCRS